MGNDFESQFSCPEEGRELGVPGWVSLVDNQTSSQSETKNPTPPKEGGMGHPLM